MFLQMDLESENSTKWMNHSSHCHENSKGLKHVYFVSTEITTFSTRRIINFFEKSLNRIYSKSGFCAAKLLGFEQALPEITND